MSPPTEKGEEKDSSSTLVRYIYKYVCVCVSCFICYSTTQKGKDKGIIKYRQKGPTSLEKSM